MAEKSGIEILDRFSALSRTNDEMVNVHRIKLANGASWVEILRVVRLKILSSFKEVINNQLFTAH